MADTNSTASRVKEFILFGITDRPELQMPLFAIFLLNYSITLMGNLGIILLIQTDRQLHSPMYFFLTHLAFVDLCYSSVIAPKMLANFLAVKKTISFHACAAQLGSFLTFMITECFLLAVMAYDRYVAICNPLLYQSIMSQRVCIRLVAAPYIYSFSVALFHTIVTFRLSFCSANVINHFYLGEEITIIPAPVYLFLSSEGPIRIMLVGLLCSFQVVFFTYLQPRTNHSLGTDKIASVFYTLVIPMLNPMIYSLRNKEGKDALKRRRERILILH
ncbi:olfactory receptor 1038-like [Python bivittatus]|uniref:Olfactory receptor 1038-like n=1 Tax=Python bivittatus TaxID=176946 RepID=A0A9F3W0P8_PYTBI|nr:olfactory receptor 1038-like [Python bivittatus]